MRFYAAGSRDTTICSIVMTLRIMVFARELGKAAETASNPTTTSLRTFLTCGQSTFKLATSFSSWVISAPILCRGIFRTMRGTEDRNRKEDYFFFFSPPRFLALAMISSPQATLAKGHIIYTTIYRIKQLLVNNLYRF